MPEAKLIISSHPWDYRSQKAIYEFEKSFTEWETITEEEYALLLNNLDLLPPVAYGCSYILLRKSDFSILETLSKIIKEIEQRIVEREVQKSQKAEKAKLAAEKRRKKQEKEELRLLKELQTKYGEVK